MVMGIKRIERDRWKNRATGLLNQHTKHDYLRVNCFMLVSVRAYQHTGRVGAMGLKYNISVVVPRYHRWQNSFNFFQPSFALISIDLPASLLITYLYQV